MKSMFLAGAAFALIGLVGCNTGPTGGPGADKKDKPNVEKGTDKVRQAEDTFSLSLPVTSTKLKQGETEEVVIGINRGKNFQEDVVLVFENLPQGVTAEPASPTIKHGDKEAKVMLKAKDDAALGDHTVTVKAKPSKGKETTQELKVTVNKK